MDVQLFRQYIKNPLLAMSKPDINLLSEVIIKYPYFQSAHLLHFLANYFHKNILSEKELKHAAVFAGERSKLYNYITQANWQLPSLSPIITEKQTVERPKDSASIIDRFLEKPPVIQKPKAEFFNPLDKAAKSIIEEEEFVSETLAGIYVRLNKFEKAIGIYKKLCLLYPEKYNYFAAQIEYLKNKIDQ